jgi:hypothetical protein
VVEELVNDVFEVGKNSIDRVFRRQSIEDRTQLDNRVPQFPFDRADAVDVL